MKFYRYIAVQYAQSDEFGEYIPCQIPDPKVQLWTFDLISETDKGYWIGNRGGIASKKRWVSKTAKKRFAYPSQQEALNNFIKRNESRIKILSHQKLSCEISVRRANQILNKLSTEIK